MATTEESKTVLIAIDPSEHALRAFEFFFENLYHSDMTILLVHSAEQLKLSAVSIAQPSMNIPTQQWEAEAKKRNHEVNKLEADYTQRLIEKRVKYKSKVMYEGKPGESIIKIAEEEGAKMIIMGTRGLGSIRRTILGSVSDYVVHHACCPVIICPPTERKKRSKSKSDVHSEQ